MRLVFTDLDNTLIYSKRRITNISDFVCVEKYNGEDLSFMTKSSREKLSELLKLDDTIVVPITTRVDYQFNRILLFDFKYVLVDNGGILLVNGVVDKSWYSESLMYATLCKVELTKAFNLLKEDENRVLDVRFLDNLFIFTKSRNPDKTFSLLSSNLDLNKVNILVQGSKFYIIPKELSKGNAINRFKNLVKSDYIISAGDNELDFSMADYSDVFITSNTLCTAKNSIISKSNIFSDEFLDYVLSY